MYKNYTTKIGVPDRVCPKLLLIMRFTTVILLATFMQVSAAGYAQKISINKSDTDLRTVLRELRVKSGYDFVYTDMLLRKAKPVTIDIQQAKIEDILPIVFKDQPLVYVIENNTVIIKTRERSLLDKLVERFKAIDIRGRVTDGNGIPMGGVNVHVDGESRRTVTSALGAFQLANVNENATIVFEYIGFKSKRFKAADIRDAETNGVGFSVVMVEAENSLNEVVAVGYGSVKRKDLTGSVASINVNEVRNTPFVSIDQAMAGKAAGVQVMQADGSPGGMAKIRIRGGSSLIGGNDPLYIIDGVQMTLQNRYVQSGADVINPVENLGNDANYTGSAAGSSFGRGLNSLAGLNINDIESIDILKDASATAIYGSRAANGVVIITTKKGKLNEKPILEVNYYTGISQAITEKVLNADQYKGVMLEGARNLNAIRQAEGLAADPIANSVINDPNFLGNANTNWIDLVTRTGVTQNADVSIRGGGTGSRYYTSLAYNNQKGTLLGTDFTRIAGKVNLDNEITSKLRLITNIDYAFTKNNITNGIYSSALYAPPTFEPYTADGSPSVFNQGTFSINSNSGIQNPMALLKGRNQADNTLLLGSLGLEYEILKSLKFKSSASVNYSNYHQLNYVPSTVNISDGVFGAANSNGGVATQAQNQMTDVFFENTLTYDKQFNKDNRLNFLLGTSWQQTNSKTFSASGQGFPDDEFLNGLSSAALPLPPQASEAQSALLSFYLRANYSLKEKYLLTITARSDESSKFPKNNRVSYFPSFGVAWKANEESFLKSATWLNELKFRASAGYTGSQNLGNNLFYTLYTPGSYGGTNALIPTQLGNDKIKWETTLQKDAGIDFAMFDSRFRGALGYYHKATKDLLMAFSVASSSGYNSALVNVADITNEGLEIDLRVDAIRKKNFNWNVALNVSGNRSKVTKINRELQNPNTVSTEDEYVNSLNLGNTVLREGQPVGLLYGYTFDGIIKNQQELDAYKEANIYVKYGIIDNVAIGYPKYKLYEEGLYKGTFKRDVIGNAQPDYYGGITNSFSYKNFSVIALTTFSVGGDILYLPEVKSLGLGDRSNRSTRILLPHYTSETPDANRPSLVLRESNTVLTGSSSLAVKDASYLKLKSISFNYQLPETFLKKMGVRNAMLYASGSNLFIISGYPGPDPEISNDPYSLISGYTDSATYPSTRQYTFGMRLGF
jgi:TonB-linked SusC/RagA family outer membrane protein